MSDPADRVGTAVAEARAALRAGKPRVVADILWAAETLARGDPRAVRELLQTTRELLPQLTGRGARGARRSMETLTDALKEQLSALEEFGTVEQVAKPLPASPQAPLAIAFWWAAASVIVMAIGAFGPWAKVPGGISVSGIDRSNDGWLVVAVAVFAVLFAYPATRYRSRGVHVLTLLSGVAAVAITANDRHNIHNRISAGSIGHAAVQVGWGLNLALIGSLSLILAALVLVVVTSLSGSAAVASAAAEEASEREEPEEPAPSLTETQRSEIEARLDTLERLKARGLVTEAEYAEKRAAILAEL